MGLVFIHVSLCDLLVFPSLASGILNLSHELVTVQTCLLFGFENSRVVQLPGLGTFTSESAGSIQSWGTKIPQAARCGLNKKKKDIKKFNKIRVHITPLVPGLCCRQTQGTQIKQFHGREKTSKFLRVNYILTQWQSWEEVCHFPNLGKKWLVSP